MPINLFSVRHTTDDLGDTLRINIPNQKQWFRILFMGFWLIGWAFGVSSALSIIFHGQGFAEQDLFTIVWLVGWTIGGAFVVYILLWQLFGKQVVEVSKQALTINQIGFGFGFPKKYLVEHIKLFRISTSTNIYGMFGWSWTRKLSDGLSYGLIAFDYGSKTINFGGGINKAESKQILIEITLFLCEGFTIL